MNKPSKILLISSSLPGTIGVGGVLLDDMCQVLPKGSLCTFVVNSFGEDYTKSKANYLSSHQLHSACSWALPPSRFGRLGKFLQWLKISLKNRLLIRKLAKAAIQFAHQQDVQKIWVVLEAPVVMEVANRVTRQLDIPFYAMVWDDIEQLLPLFGVNRLSGSTISRNFARLVEGSEKCAVIGESMKDEYDSKYGVDSIIVRHGIEDSLILKPNTYPSNEGPIKIGFTGSVSARSAFSAFITALDQKGWSIDGREVILQLTGLKFNLVCRSPARIEYMGWRTVQECVGFLSQCDFNYLPQPFEPNLAALARLSFPTKVTTYLAAGRPVLLHCPERASLYKFNDKYSIGAWCGSLEPGQIADSLSRLVNDQALTQSFVQAGQRAINENFTSHAFKHAFADFLDIN